MSIGRDVIKKIIPMLIDSPPSTREYHANYQRLNRNLEKESKHNNNPSINNLERQAERLIKEIENVLDKKKRI